MRCDGKNYVMKYLDEWYRDGKIEICDFFEWLKKQTSEEWHLATVYTTLDGDQEVLWWVVNQPDCELSTALNIFWAGDPAGALDGSYSRIFLHGDRSGGLYKPLTSIYPNFLNLGALRFVSKIGINAEDNNKEIKINGSYFSGLLKFNRRVPSDSPIRVTTI